MAESTKSQDSLVITVANRTGTTAVAHHLATHLRGGDGLVLTGDLGAGKTTFTQALATGLKITDPVKSPTFVIAHHHRNQHPGLPDLVHVDAYRISGADELASLDLDTDLEQSVTVIEWGRGLAEALFATTGWLELDFQRCGTPDPTAPMVTDFSEADDHDESRRIVVCDHHSRFHLAELIPDHPAVVFEESTGPDQP
ncbi:tRNA (adenosine(37)-N6)-threonylcarbamoyltransferase complex ATPase subunit type 1 TsaE [Auritidibacter ignavus]|uniref:tRNA (adenosine(37)-N6)-threonylcarbamoyltransferase complex ATPase subunit type 1 TsaE n=1 Tax=Auritidibacter ignavus TaxID=678932 RepID=UPI000F02B2FD|nr:tRNA (adenosine(37)-N6)-threonylcarbamoyltransferase complex ATPase subunit type 1 TsaE [Auritidibacter ignavus]NIH71465.1 tRNA threonylcarbamoyladenosine biosynthesis protein TsaE [Auritidibacter ignavus]RMX22836.1 tRNA (adenosine(37)-N6)-threonylcarbamoyltransferase complex ATPase subunit type 1 TsaE [Auritidibacter ignavus]